jgi:CubicO group peptidase (beta-lactamase class C family)
MSGEARSREHLPRAEEFLYWPPSIQPWGYRIVDRLFATRAVPASGRPRVLPQGEVVDARDRVGDQALTIDRFIDRNHVAGLMVLRDGAVVCERYALGLRESDRWSTMSTIKSMTAILVGAAVKDGAIASIDDPVPKYLAALRGSAYERVTVRHLLTMSTGVGWTEVYEDPDSDVNKYSRSIANRVPGGVLDLMRGIPPGDAPGSGFRYNSGDSFLLGALVSAATGRQLADYMAEKIWQPFGMEFDAFYTLESEGGQEIGGSRGGVALRDFARFGLFVAQDGVIDGRPTLPEGWVRDCGTPAFPVVDPVHNAAGVTHYGYCWWLEADGAMNAFGFAGQRIRISADRRTVIVILSAVPQPPWVTSMCPDTVAETRSLIAAIAAALA